MADVPTINIAKPPEVVNSKPDQNAQTFASAGREYKQPNSVFNTTQVREQKYNELFHAVELYLDNSGDFKGDEKYRFHLNPSSVLNLTISDTFNNWCTEGSLTFFYLPDDAPTDSSTGQTSQTFINGAKENAKLLKTYQFRSDGFDLLRVRISPLIKQDGQSSTQLPVKEDDPKWWLSYVFSVFDYEDIGEIPEALGPAAFYMKCIK